MSGTESVLHTLSLTRFYGKRLGIEDVNLMYLGEASLSTMLLALVFGTRALFLGCLRGSRGLSIGVTGALAMITYFLNSLVGIVEALKPYCVLLPFYYHWLPLNVVT